MELPFASVTLRIGERIPLLTGMTYKVPNFMSKNNKVACVSEYGVLIGQSAGSTLVTAIADGSRMKLQVTVIDEIFSGNAIPVYAGDLQIVAPINGNEKVEISALPADQYKETEWSYEDGGTASSNNGHRWRLINPCINIEK